MKTITVNARRWFEKTNGNTYHSCAVYLDGELVGKVPFTYGYGTQYLQTAADILNDAGVHYFSGFADRCAAKDAGFAFVEICTDVARKRDL